MEKFRKNIRGWMVLDARVFPASVYTLCLAAENGFIFFERANVFSKETFRYIEMLADREERVAKEALLHVEHLSQHACLILDCNQHTQI